MPYTRIKICGITRPENATLAAELGADAIGLNFVRGPRRIDQQTGYQILSSLPPCVTPVGLTGCGIKGTDCPSIHQLRHEDPRLSITTFQIYGEVPPEVIKRTADVFCWMVSSIPSRQAMATLAAQVAKWGESVRAIVLDTASADKLGGTGQSFNWHWIAEARAAGELEGLPPIILAGGLTPENVAEAIRIAQPYAVDVSSGVEVPGKPGIKDPVKMRDFIQAARSV
jgi:phosphoribosylanthranilate isomerase